MKKSYELAYDKFIEACGKWAEAKYERRLVLGAKSESETEGDNQLSYDKAAMAERDAQWLMAQYISQRLEHEQKYGKGK